MISPPTDAESLRRISEPAADSHKLQIPDVGLIVTQADVQAPEGRHEC